MRVDTFGGTVYLTGAVGTAKQKSNAEIAAWNVEGVQQVVNDLVVVRPPDAVSALPNFRMGHPLTERLPGVVRVWIPAAPVVRTWRTPPVGAAWPASTPWPGVT